MSSNGEVPLGGVLRETTLGAVAELAEMMEAASDPKSAIELRERMAEVELALEDLGWVRMGWETQGELSRSGLRKLSMICRQLYLKHPLINHAVNVQTHYVWGQGISVVGKAAEVNEVVQSWWDLKENKVELTGHRARMLKERELWVAGNNFLALFTEPTRGTVRVRSIMTDEIEKIVSNPEDRREPWYYHRRWQQETMYDPTIGVSVGTESVDAYYPDWLYKPKERPAKIDGIPVKWDSPVYHMKIGGLDNMRFGVPQLFPAIDWARAVQADLENYATVKRALAKFANILTVKGGPGTVAAAKAFLATTISDSVSTGEHNPAPVAGSTFLQREGVAKLEPVRTAGMQPNPDEGRRLGLMVGAGVGIPETMLWGDATIGNYATAKSLDRPTELQMMARQQDWVDTFSDVIGYVLDSNSLARKGQLKGRMKPDLYSGRDQVIILSKAGAELDRRVDISFPAILQHDELATVQAIATAYTMNGQAAAGLVDARTAARLLLVAMRVPNVDEVLAATHPDEPNPPADVPKVAPPPAPVAVPAPEPPAPPEATPPAEPPATEASVLALRQHIDEGLRAVAQARNREELLEVLDRARTDFGPLVEVLTKQAEATSALASRPLEVAVTLPAPAPPRRVVRETKFTEDDKGHVVGKRETEEEV